MRTAAAGPSDQWLLPLIIIVAIALWLWRNANRRGQAVRGEDVAPAVDSALQRLLAGETRYVVVSVSADVYLQFASGPNGTILGEANCPPGNATAVMALSNAGLSAVEGRPNHRGEFASADAGQLSALACSYLAALGAESVRIRTIR